MIGRTARGGISRRITRMEFLLAALAQRRYCIGCVVALLLIMLGSVQLMAAARQPDGRQQVFDLFNAERTRMRVMKVERHPDLDRLAERYLASILETRNLSLSAHRPAQVASLYHEVAVALGEGGAAYRYTGITVAYGVNTRQAVAAGVGREANRPATLDPVYQIAGIAVGTVPPGALWFAPATGDSERDVELTGQTIVVILMAGTYRG